ncbi:MAG: hypothetical protein A2W52_00745 [Candidatus Taylorbacteria bacterium RIFCSPHIGHO2_02_49_25]|uniref:Uncharacterized protein n=1 Tax=Candidatus Taylorbacteria bacterium RIFCSPHIGHO2_02_49_25 TaxID=1802305 RepID=A0A1G2ME57_9BACT|nr:MAG: hypothetical protein A2759_01475 [Candidatus Taylorbacteria bacterium RIFCSPHIGHO2_01_FULL_49_60]OHA22195.1 MAG: hypothetical protein A2W52_00745 [Candidatus Taylorbacteria bacterium RIFCSPHIGHO2_02_49_25]OHA35606.1 MAG: hypothetical protein A3B27_01955 [Candidatus Taylorbacteria bacterium RIFCSPLOWO2_01_FULL_50_130]OHA36074.1 MAG: hypothetical protein A2W65_04295 [Candidatus Taylorbacteria bacterium RIFCSPLOWO2_02_50_13]OHA41225.1 MAG: hypothetical protein A3H73_01865 [Candidatus Taylo
MSVVKRIGEDKGRTGSVDFLSMFCQKLVLRQKHADSIKRLITLCIHLKRLTNYRRGFFVYDNRFCSRVVDVTYWRKSRIFAAPDFLAQTSFGIFGKRIHIILALSERHVKHKLSLRSGVAPKSRKFQARKFSCVEEINHFTSIHRIAGEAIGVPR